MSDTRTYDDIKQETGFDPSTVKRESHLEFMERHDHETWLELVNGEIMLCTEVEVEVDDESADEPAEQEEETKADLRSVQQEEESEKS